MTNRRRHEHGSSHEARAIFRTTEFTLLELLVVITVITILASLLLPALTKAKAYSVRGSCLNNMRQIGVTWSMYANDYGGFTVPGINYGEPDSWLDSYWTSWCLYFHCSMGDSFFFNSLTCPSSPQKKRFTPPYSYSDALAVMGNAHYSYNHLSLSTQTIKIPRSTDGVLVNFYVPVRAERILNPSAKLAFCDYGAGKNINQAYGYNSSYAIAYEDYIPGGGAYPTATAKLAGGTITGTGNEAYLEDFMQGRHIGAVNVLFDDGHALPNRDVPSAFYHSKPYVGLFAPWNEQ